MTVIADTSPINYLIWIEQVNVLPKLYGRILIPPRGGVRVVRAIRLKAEDSPSQTTSDFLR